MDLVGVTENEGVMDGEGRIDDVIDPDGVPAGVTEEDCVWDGVIEDEGVSELEGVFEGDGGGGCLHGTATLNADACGTLD